jgi:hypothetical protein
MATIVHHLQLDIIGRLHPTGITTMLDQSLQILTAVHPKAITGHELTRTTEVSEVPLQLELYHRSHTSGVQLRDQEVVLEVGLWQCNSRRHPPNLMAAMVLSVVGRRACMLAELAMKLAACVRRVLPTLQE